MANTTRSNVVALFDNSADAQAASNELKSNGIDNDDIYIGSGSSATTSAGAQTGYSDERSAGHTQGGVIGWLKSLFESDEDADRGRYQNAVAGGKILLSVETTEDNIDRVAEILNRHSPVNVHEEATSGRAVSTAAGTSTGAAYAGAQRAATTGPQTNQGEAIPVVEEEIRVGKRSIQRGGVRVYSRVVEQPVEESVRLRQEQVRVERQPVNRPATEADLRNREQQVVEVREYAEEPVVSKQARVVEEVRVGKDSTERTETVRDTIRRTEVEVENLDEQNVRRGSAGTTTDEDEEDDLRTNTATPRG